MRVGPIRLRRARRTDFVSLMELGACRRLPMPPADRTTLHRFRRLVAEQGADLYVALVDDQAVGFIHVTYARQLASAARARIESLVVRGPHAQGAGGLLLDLAVRRARKRGCAGLCWVPAASDATAQGLIDAGGWRPAGDVFCFDLLDASGSGDG